MARNPKTQLPTSGRITGGHFQSDNQKIGITTLLMVKNWLKS